MEFHPGKTVILATSGKHTEVKLNGQILKQVSEIEYLGDVITEDGKLDATIEQRKQKATGVTAELCAIISELGKSSKLQAIIQYYNGIIVPRTLFNSETWNNETNENIENLESTLHRSLKRLLKIPYSTPTKGLYRELGLMSAKNQIAIKKIMFLHRMLTGKNILVKEILKEQKKIPGKTWISNTLNLMEEMNITTNENEIENMKKEEWKRIVKKKVWDHENMETSKALRNAKKCQLIKDKDNKIKPYIKELEKEDAMIILMARLDMVDVKNNYKGMHKDLKCTICKEEVETLQHLMNCPHIIKEVWKNKPENINKMLKSEDITTLKTAAKAIKQAIDIKLQKQESSSIQEDEEQPIRSKE